MRNIATLTVNPALDVYSIVEKVEPEKKIRCEIPSTDPGGGGVNVSRVIKRLGGDAITIYTRGGYTGEKFTELLEKEGLHQETVELKKNLRQNFAIFEESTGNLFRFGFPGAEMEESEYNTLLKKIDYLTNVEYLVASGSLPPNAPADFYKRVAKLAKQKNLKLVVDTSGEAFSGILEEGAYLLKPNLEELKDLTGKEAETDAEQESLLKEVISKYPIEVIVLSMGKKGAVLATKDKIQRFPAPKVEALSSIGAGDSMVAGIVFGLSQGKSLSNAVRLGLACGSATIKSPGTQLLKKEDVEELYEELDD